MAIVLEKTWNTFLHQTRTATTVLDNTKHQLWWIAAALTGNIGGLSSGIWTLYASSDSSTAGTDSTDRWLLASGYDESKIVRASGAGAHSWIVLKSPSMAGSFWYVILSFNTSSDNDVRISFAKTAPSGGSITVTPTSADTWHPASTSMSAASVQMHQNTQAASLRPLRNHLILSTAGDFIYLSGRTHMTGEPESCVMFHTLSDTPAAETIPVWAFANSVNGTGLSHLSNSGQCNPYAQGGGTLLIKHDGTATARFSFVVVPAQYVSATTGTQWGSGSTLTGPADVRGNRTGFPWLVFEAAATNSSVAWYRGRIADLSVCLQPLEYIRSGATAPRGGPVQLCLAGRTWVPSDEPINFY